jgi:HEAT repeat protein
MAASSLTRPVRSLFQVQADEAALVAVMILYSAAAVGGVLTIGFNGVAQALFLSRLPASDVPYTFILPAVAITLTLAAYSRLAVRFSLGRLAVGSSVLLLLVGALFRLLLALGHSSSFGVLAGIYLYCEVAASLVIVQFWTFAGQIFNPRQARRLFGLIAAGGTLSSAAAGLLLSFLTRSIGVENLVLIVAGCCGVCAACALYLRPHLHSKAPMDRNEIEPDRVRLQDDLRRIWRAPLLRSIAIITILASLLLNIGAYQFFLVLHSSYAGRSAALAGFLGAFALWTGLAALAVQLFGTGPMMVRFGAVAAQGTFPLAMVVAAAITLAAWGPLWAVTATRALDPTVRRTVHDASLNALYLPIPAEQRQRARTVLEVVYASTFGLAGVAFLLMQRAAPSWTYQYWSIPVVVFGVVWIAVLVGVRGQYVSALARSIGNRRLTFEGLNLDLTDETTRSVLSGALRSSDDRIVVHVLDLLERTDEQEWLPQVVPLLERPSPHVRVMTVRFLERAGGPACADAVAGMLAAPEDDVSSAAVHALGALRGSDAAGLVAPLLADRRPHTAGAATTVLLRYGDAGRHRAAAERLQSMLESDRPEHRREAARVLGSLAGYSLDAETLDVLGGPVNVGADLDGPAATAGVLVDRLLRLLEDKWTRDAAADSLTLYGGFALPDLAGVLADSRHDPATRIQAAVVVQRIGGPEAARILLDHCAEPDLAVRTAIASALARLRVHDQTAKTDETHVHDRIMAEIADCYKLHRYSADLRMDEESALLRETLGERIDRTLDRVFLLLEARFRGHDLARVRRAVTSMDTSGRAMAVELLDSLADRRIGEFLVPLLEGSDERILAIATGRLGMLPQPAVERVADLAACDDPWLRACAIFRVGRLPDSRLTPLAIAALDADDDLVRESALAACRQFLGPAQLVEVAAEQVNATGFPMAQRYAWSLLLEIGAT